MFYYGIDPLVTQPRQEAVAEGDARDAPFDLEKTTRVFETTSSGGVKKVTADDPADHISLIRKHFREEASKFGWDGFSDSRRSTGSTRRGEKLEAGGGSICATQSCRTASR